MSQRNFTAKTSGGAAKKQATSTAGKTSPSAKTTAPVQQTRKASAPGKTTP